MRPISGISVAILICVLFTALEKNLKAANSWCSVLGISLPPPPGQQLHAGSTKAAESCCPRQGAESTYTQEAQSLEARLLEGSLWLRGRQNHGERLAAGRQEGAVFVAGRVASPVGNVTAMGNLGAILQTVLDGDRQDLVVP